VKSSVPCLNIFTKNLSPGFGLGHLRVHGAKRNQTPRFKSKLNNTFHSLRHQAGRHSQPSLILSPLLVAPFPVRPSYHPTSSFACCPTGTRLACLGVFIVPFPTLIRDLEITGQGKLYPTGTRFPKPDFSLISGSTGLKASTRSRGPVPRVTCQGNQGSPSL